MKQSFKAVEKQTRYTKTDRNSNYIQFNYMQKEHETLLFYLNFWVFSREGNHNSNIVQTRISAWEFYRIKGGNFHSINFLARFPHQFSTFIAKVGDFLTSQNVDIISPRSSFSISTPIRFSVFCICSIRVFCWRTPPLMLNREHTKAAPFCSQSAFPSSVPSPAVTPF